LIGRLHGRFGGKMKYDLICASSAEELGIVDDRGHFDMSKFHSHIENCEVCLELMETFVKVMDNKARRKRRIGKKAKRVSSKRNRS
jgi:hypothetical protein